MKAVSAPVKIIHRLPGRVRFGVPDLKAKPLLAAVIKQRLLHIPGVCRVEANAHTGRVLVVFGAADSRLLSAMAVTATGYPVFKNGWQGLTNGCINYDLVMGLLALSILVRRQFIPALAVLWLYNLSNIGQLAMLKHYHRGAPIADRREPGQEYEHKVVLPWAGLALLTGVTGGAGSWNKLTPMLLAANPAPARLAAPAAAQQTIRTAARTGIIYLDQRIPEQLSVIDTVIFTWAGDIAKEWYLLGDVLPMPAVSKEELLVLAGAALRTESDVDSRILEKVLADQGYIRPTPEDDLGQPDSLLVGDQQKLQNAGVNVNPGLFKAARLRQLSQYPVFVACRGHLIGLFGVKTKNIMAVSNMIVQMQGQGIKHMIMITEGSNNLLKETARKVGISQIWAGLTRAEQADLIKGLKKQGRRIVLVAVGSQSLPVAGAEVTVCLEQSDRADMTLARLDLLPRIFYLGLLTELKVQRNLAFVRVADAAGLVLGAAGCLTPLTAVVFNNLISVAMGVVNYTQGGGGNQWDRPFVQ